MNVGDLRLEIRGFCEHGFQGRFLPVADFKKVIGFGVFELKLGW